MTDEVYQQIKEYEEEANSLYERIHEQVEASIVKHAQVKKRRKKLFASLLSVAAVLVVTLSIVLPIVIQPQEQVKRYSTPNELLPEMLDYNLKEYSELNNNASLYLDWYEYAEDLATVRYYENGKESNTAYLLEEFTDGNTGYRVQIIVMKRNIVVESFDARYEECPSANIGDTQIIYALSKSGSYAKFEYQGYKYYLQIDDSLTLDFLVETIESMINN